jgi:hypothetical protein
MHSGLLGNSGKEKNVIITTLQQDEAVDRLTAIASFQPPRWTIEMIVVEMIVAAFAQGLVYAGCISLG